MSAASGNISEGMMDRLLDVVRKQILDFSGEIREGQVTRNPVKNRKTTACAYCSWNGLCGFDPKIPGSMFRRIPVYSKDRIFEEIIRQDCPGVKTYIAETCTNPILYL